jgi:hypothetical protein
VISAQELGQYIAELEQMAACVAESQTSASIDLGFASADVHPAGERPDTTSHVGPILSGDMWTRYGLRLRTKAKQTRGVDRTWIRIDEGGGLIALTPARSLPIEELLRLLIYNTKIELDDFPHVEGVIMSHGAAPDWNALDREHSFRDPVTGSAAFDLRLPGGRRRRTYVIKLAGSKLILPPHLQIDPSPWFAREAGWLDWALGRLGKPSIDSTLGNEGRRRLIP